LEWREPIIRHLPQVKRNFEIVYSNVAAGECVRWTGALEDPHVPEAASLFFGRSPSFARGTNPTLGPGGSLHLGEVEDR
jgi:hypothetical protein